MKDKYTVQMKLTIPVTTTLLRSGTKAKLKVCTIGQTDAAAWKTEYMLVNVNIYIFQVMYYLPGRDEFTFYLFNGLFISVSF